MGYKFGYKDLLLVKNINNMAVKLGYQLLARQYLKGLNLNKPGIQYTTIGYHVSAFVFFTKAFLDSLAVLLNDYHKLGLSKGDIDLNKTVFMNKLGTANSQTKSEISKYKKWIKSVIDWRDSLIHRISTPTVPFDPNRSGNYTALLPMEPSPMFEPGHLSILKRKYGKSMQDILPFCDGWINNSKGLFEFLGNEFAEVYNDC